MITIFLLTLATGIINTMSSRSRNRSNMTYHMVCQIASHTSWLLVLVNLMSQPIGLYEGVAYVSGYTIGSLIGAKISMRIETLIGATA